jgi:predicted nucleic acid-binding protein
MNAIFADTSYFVAANSPRDSAHALAKELGKELDSGIITTEYILVETSNFFTHPALRSIQSQIVRELRNSPSSQIIPSSSDLFDRGLALFESRPDKEWSLTDCISFIVMGDLGLAEALTADHHFEQAGFIALLK